MKKILGISLVAVLAVSPLMAMAAEGDRSASLTKLNATDPGTTSNLATTSYVGGAYKTTADKIDLLIDDTAVTTNGNYIDAGKSVSANLTELDSAVKANKDALDVLNGDDTVAGSVASQIADALQDYEGTSASVGDLDDLNTTNKDSVVGAINSVDSAVNKLENKTITYVESWSNPQPVTTTLVGLPPVE